MVGSAVWASSGLNTIGVLLEWLDGKYDQLGFFDKVLWVLTRLGWNALFGLSFLGNLNYHMGVYTRNAQYYYIKDAAATASAWWFRVFFLFNLVVRIIAPGMYDADWEDIDSRGLDYSLSQATSYHYWEGKENHSIFTMFWVNYVSDGL